MLKTLKVKSQENEKHVTRNRETRLKCVMLGRKQNWYGYLAKISSNMLKVCSGFS